MGVAWTPSETEHSPSGFAHCPCVLIAHVHALTYSPCVVASDLAVVGERYSTSKICGLEDLATASTLGYRGEALASLGEIAILSLHTRAASNCDCALEKWIQAGATLSLGKAAKTRQVGTTVTVRDLFGNFPVRRKALQVEARKELQRTKQLLIRFALAHCTLSFSLYDSQRSSTVLQTQAVPDPLSCFRHLFGPAQAGKLVVFDSLACPNASEQHRLEKQSAATGDTPTFRLHGYVSKPGSQGYHTKELQYLYGTPGSPHHAPFFLRAHAFWQQQFNN